jgi:hypothetical protein
MRLASRPARRLRRHGKLPPPGRFWGDSCTDEWAWRIGADGEEKVAAQFDKVAGKDPRWQFIHAIPVGTRGSDIDHLVVGPGGVFTVNAKNHPNAKVWVGGDTFLVNGHR